MDMKKLIQKMTDIEAGKKMLNESVVDECGGSMPMAPQQQGNPVTVSVNFNASGAENVMELLNLLKNSGLQDAEGPSEPSQGMRMDMEHFRNIVDAGDDDMDMDPDMDSDMKPNAKFNMRPTGKGMLSKGVSEWGNDPNEIYADHQTMTHDLSGGINGKKDTFPRVSPGDNPMQKIRREGIDKESLKSRLLQALEEKKSTSKKPDKDGDRVPDWADKNPGKDDKIKETKKKVDEAGKHFYYPDEAPTPLPDKKAYAVDKASEKKKPVSLKKAPWEKDKSVTEAGRFRLVSKAENGNRAVKIYKDTEWGEYVVKHYENGEYLKEADYYDADKQAAIDTAKYFLSQGKTQESSVQERSTGDYSAKKARAGKDIGQQGENFKKIAKSAAKRYGSKERGEKVAGAVLAKLRNK